MTARKGYVSQVLDLVAWPPNEDWEILRSHDDGQAEATLRADPRGRLIVRNDGVDTVYQPLELTGGGGLVMVSVDWEHSAVFIGGALLRFDGPDIPPRVVETGKPLPIDGRHFLTLDATAGSTVEEIHFLETLIELDKRVEARTNYDLIKAGGLLRLLLADPTPLIHRVNREHGLDLRFTIRARETAPPPIPDARWFTNLDPQYSKLKRVDVKIDGLLAATIFRSPDGDSSVLDLIRVCANARGGVHVGYPANELEKQLLVLDLGNKMLQLGPSLIALSGLCHVVMRALTPLAMAVEHRGRSKR